MNGDYSTLELKMACLSRKVNLEQSFLRNNKFIYTKGFISFIIAIILYLVIGLIAWNIVCSIIDVPSMTLIELADYRICTYSAIPMLIMIILFVCIGGDESALLFVELLLALNAGIAIATNHWEGIWPSVCVILTIIYNLVNVFFITGVIRMCFNDGK